MQQASSPVPVGPAQGRSSDTPRTDSNRTIWVYTGYIAAALGLLGVLAYHFSGVLLK